MALDSLFIPVDIVKALMAADFQGHCADIARERGEPVPPALLAVRDDPRPFAGADVNGPSARIGNVSLDFAEPPPADLRARETCLVPVTIADMTGGADPEALAAVMRIRAAGLARTFAASEIHTLYGGPPYEGRLRYKTRKLDTGTAVELPYKASSVWWQAVRAQVYFQFIESL